MAASLLGCSCVEIDRREYISFPCALQQCHKCENRWDDLVPMLDKCSTALYLLAMQALMLGKMFYHFVKCARHGKCRRNAEGGAHKTFCDTAFDRFVKTPKEERQGSRWAPSHKVEIGKICSLASTLCDILNDEDHARVAISHSSRKKGMKTDLHLICHELFLVLFGGTIFRREFFSLAKGTPSPPTTTPSFYGRRHLRYVPRQ